MTTWSGNRQISNSTVGRTFKYSRVLLSCHRGNSLTILVKSWSSVKNWIIFYWNLLRIPTHDKLSCLQCNVMWVRKKTQSQLLIFLLYFYGHFHWYFALNNNNVPQGLNKCLSPSLTSMTRIYVIILQQNNAGFFIALWEFTFTLFFCLLKNWSPL